VMIACFVRRGFVREGFERKSLPVLRLELVTHAGRFAAGRARATEHLARFAGWAAVRRRA